tara:strand:- start:414 stop:902 length:489 start_codon:yes stop_codon:yes gene_type:complete
MVKRKNSDRPKSSKSTSLKNKKRKTEENKFWKDLYSDLIKHVFLKKKNINGQLIGFIPGYHCWENFYQFKVYYIEEKVLEFVIDKPGNEDLLVLNFGQSLKNAVKNFVCDLGKNRQICLKDKQLFEFYKKVVTKMKENITIGVKALEKNFLDKEEDTYCMEN